MDENETALAEELASPAIGQSEPEVEEELESNSPDDEDDSIDGEDDGEVDNPDDQAAAPELIDIEQDGETFKVPAKLKDAFLRQADYTRKTQEVAETRKAAEALKAEAEQEFNVSQEVLGARAHLQNIDQQLEHLKTVDWAKYEQEDPVGAMSTWRQYQTLKEQRGEVSGFLQHQQTTRAEQAKQETDKRLRETREFAEKEIPGWTPDIDAKITEFATSKGFTRETLLNAYSPPVYEILHLAWLGQQSIEKQRAKPAPAPAPTQPLTKVATRATPVTGLDDRLSAEEWIKRRNERAKR